MSRYLARLKAVTAKNSETRLPDEPSKGSKARLELSKGPFEPFEGRRGSSFSRNDGSEADIEERAALAAGDVPGVYLDAWARLQCQKPLRMPDDEWQQAIDDGGRFIDQWADLAVEFGWTVNDLFDVPRDAWPGGLIWFFHGELLRALGPYHAVTTSGRVFDRMSLRRDA